MTVAVEWQKTVQASLAAMLDVVKSLSLTLAGQLTGGASSFHPPTNEDAQLTVSMSGVDTQLTMPPLKITIGAMDFIKESITTTPQVKIVTRVNPQTGSLETLTQLIDPITHLRYTYHFSFSAGRLTLFPLLLAHQQQQLFSSSLASPPAVTFTLDELKLEGPLKPALDWQKYLTIVEKQNIIRAAGSEQEKRAEVDKQDEEERIKESLVALLTAHTGVDVGAILMPYLLSKQHDMKMLVKLQIQIVNKQAFHHPHTAAEAYAEALLMSTDANTPVELPALDIAEDGSTSASTSNPQGSVTSISFLSSSSSVLAISTHELKEKLERYKDVVLTVDVPITRQVAMIDENIVGKREEKREEMVGDRTNDKKGEQRMEEEEICVDISFKVTLAQLITDVMQLAMG
jgi:hypothetical protein